MKRLLLLLPALLVLAAPRLDAQMSTGNYRIPYSSGTDVAVLQDHASHPLTNRVDLRAIGTNTPYAIRAAADGTVRFIRDNGTAGCGTCTNYVWIQHSNGEWTGYFHLQRGSATTNAALTVGAPVTNGQFIGLEGTVGSPSGLRLRFEVGVPVDPDDPIVVNTGMIKGSSRIPVICNIPGNVLRQSVPQYTAAPCFAFEFSYGTYRLPYSNNVTMKVNNDHLTHSPSKTRYDLGGQGGAGLDPTYPIVAAAAGQVMWIVDYNTNTCSTCSSSNNYVWIRHSNGEWTKYTHFMTGSVTTNAGITVGMNVAAGRYLGDEGKIGAASGDHLHFEVAVPNNGHLYTNAFQPDITDAFQVSGGFINGVNRIPLFCGVPGNLLFEDDIFVAGNCSGGGCTNNIVLPAKIIRGTEAYVAADTVDTGNNSISLDTYASLALLGGNKVTLRPGFRALAGSYLRAANQPCFNAP